VSEASGNESRPSGMERKLLIRPLPAELLSETMLQLGGGNDIDLGDYIEEDYLSDWRVVSHTIHFRPGRVPHTHGVSGTPPLIPQTSVSRT
jgi:hypothetical protein